MYPIRWKFFAYYNIKHVTGIPHSPTVQAVIESVNCNLKQMIIKQKGRVKNPRDRLNNTFLTLNFLNVGEKGTSVADRHCVIRKNWGTGPTNIL